jgi:hypothetical protein
MVMKLEKLREKEYKAWKDCAVVSALEEVS